MITRRGFFAALLAPLAVLPVLGWFVRRIFRSKEFRIARMPRYRSHVPPQAGYHGDLFIADDEVTFVDQLTVVDARYFAEGDLSFVSQVHRLNWRGTVTGITP